MFDMNPTAGGSVPPAVPVAATDPTALLPTAEEQAEFEANRKRIAQALQMQRGMGRPNAMGQFANTALQAWNMARKMPQKMAPPTAPGVADAASTQFGGYDTGA